MTITWSVVSAPPGGEVTFSPTSATEDVLNGIVFYVAVLFSEVGEYVLRLSVDDGELQAFDELTVTAVPPPCITLVSPVGGETLIAGQTFHIQWSAVSVNNVLIYFSSDNGSTWSELADVRLFWDTDPDWGDYVWTVADTPSTQCMIRVENWYGGWPPPPVVSGPFEIRTPSGGDNGDGCTVGSPAGACGSPALLALLGSAAMLWKRLWRPFERDAKDSR